jgi:signal transduction histidine kinase
VRHILTNLLTNAVKYSERGSAVSLAAQQLPGQIIFRVRDHGIGIPAADLKNIFTPFFRSENAASFSGTGLGLVIVKLCAERHGGNVEIESREGQGTAVTVQLPVCEPGKTEIFLNKIKSSPNEA